MRMSKVPEYGRPHDFIYGWSMPIESAAARASTMMPICTYDEGLGAMSAYKSNPSNASFVEVATDHCFPTSRVENVFAQLIVSMGKVMLETDKVHAVRFHTATIHTAFNEGKLAEDEVSTLDLNEIMRVTSETTDRQSYPLYNLIDMHDFKTNAYLDMPAETPGLDTDLEIEGTAFANNNYYDCLHYMTNGKKLQKIMTKLQTHTLTRNNPTKIIRFFQQSNTKYMNPYTMLAGMIDFPANTQAGQFGEVGDTTIETSVIQCQFHVRYMEWNHEFNHSML